MSERQPLPPLVDGRIVVDLFRDEEGEPFWFRATAKKKPWDAERQAVPADVWERYHAARRAWRLAEDEMKGRAIAIKNWKPS